MPQASDRFRAANRRHIVWIAVAVLALAFLTYFLFFTATPERATLTEDELAPATLGEEPAT